MILERFSPPFQRAAHFLNLVSPLALANAFKRRNETLAATRPGLLVLICAASAVLAIVIPIALLQLVLYVLVLHDPVTNWAMYWLYVYGGVAVPGTLIVYRFVSWRLDSLAWVGLGWATGHGFELVSFLVARQIGVNRLFILWVPITLAVGVALKADLTRWLPLQRPGRNLLAVALLIGVAGSIFFALNLVELSPFPPKISDVWIHVNNVHEFRDHNPIQDPRLAGQPLNYHLYSYAAMAAPSVITGIWSGDLVTRYCGMSVAILVGLLIFNCARTIFPNRVFAGFLGSLLFLCPLDVPALFSSKYAFGTTVMVDGLYLSTTTAGGYLFFAALLLALYCYYRRPRWQDGWLLLLLGLGATGSKSMVAPLLVSGSAGVALLQLITRRAPWLLALLPPIVLATVALWVLVPLTLAQGSYSESFRISFAQLPAVQSYYHFLSPRGWPQWVLDLIWPLGFTGLTLLGAVTTALLHLRDTRRQNYILLVSIVLVIGAVPALTLSARGYSQGFFFVYGIMAAATLAGYGVALGLAWMTRSWRRRVASVALIAVLFGLAQWSAPAPPLIHDQWIQSLQASRLYEGLPGQMRNTNERYLGSTSDSNLGAHLVMTPKLRDGLAWAREHLPRDAVFAVNLFDASPYAGYSERRAFFETILYSREVDAGKPQLALRHYSWRRRLILAWHSGKPGTVRRMVRAGITNLFLDRVNGFHVHRLTEFGRPIFQNSDIAIFALPRKP